MTNALRLFTARKMLTALSVEEVSEEYDIEYDVFAALVGINLSHNAVYHEYHSARIVDFNDALPKFQKAFGSKPM